ncbi:MAG: serine hydrolase [Acidimicrobiia bacterium]
MTIAASTASSTVPSTKTSAVTTVDLPATPAGEQLTWVLRSAATAYDAEFEARFSPAFFAQAPVDALRQQIAAAGVTGVVEIVASQPTELIVLADSAAGRVAITITVDAAAPHRILGLLAQPGELPEPPTTWAEVDSRLRATAPNTAYLAAEVGKDGSVTTLHASKADDSVPLGSAFKLYVLGAVVRSVESGALTWDRQLTITDAIKSLPSGELQDRTTGSTVTVREAAEKMIQISDNTAADLLATTVGRDAVEQMLEPMGMGAASRQRTLPFLTTRQLFTLKWGGGAESVARYSAASTEERRALLATMTDRLPGPNDLDPSVPNAIDSIEWFATPAEIVAAHAWLDAYRSKPGYEALDTILGSNPGVPVSTDVWSSSAFKGGSEPGVVFLGWLLHRNDGRVFSVVVSASDTRAAVDELEAASIGQGIIELLGEQP